jgi:RNA polymerase sigma factor (sigma-70 family)
MRDPLPLDVGVLYSRLAPAVERTVTRNLTAPPALVEEACQVAWTRLHAQRHRVPAESVLGWVTTTALREALRMLRRQAPIESLDDAGLADVIELPARMPPPDVMVELRERLAEVRRLPDRQQRMIWLQGAGFDYEEIASQTGDSKRTVERQIRTARRRLRVGGASGRARAFAAAAPPD